MSGAQLAMSGRAMGYMRVTHEICAMSSSSGSLSSSGASIFARTVTSQSQSRTSVNRVQQNCARRTLIRSFPSSTFRRISASPATRYRARHRVHDIDEALHLPHVRVRESIQARPDDALEDRDPVLQLDDRREGWGQKAIYRQSSHSRSAEPGVASAEASRRVPERAYTQAFSAAPYGLGASVTSGSKECPRAPCPISSSAMRLSQLVISTSFVGEV